MPSVLETSLCPLEQPGAQATPNLASMRGAAASYGNEVYDDYEDPVGTSGRGHAVD